MFLEGIGKSAESPVTIAENPSPREEMQKEYAGGSQRDFRLSGTEVPLDARPSMVRLRIPAAGVVRVFPWLAAASLERATWDLRAMLSLHIACFSLT